MSKQYDLVVLGGGLGGYVAAIRASQLGMNVALVEAEKLGGTCLHKGCIPTKALLKTAELFRQIKNANEHGIELNIERFHFKDAQARKDNIVAKLTSGIELLMKKNNISVYNGYGRILGPSIFSPIPGTISVEHKENKENTMLIPKYVLIATGAKPKTIPNIKIDHEIIISSEDLLALNELPSSLIIVGGGVIGVEFASLLHDLGVHVTIIEAAPNLLMNEDEDVRIYFEKMIEKRGINVYTNAKLITEEVKVNKNGLVVQIKQDDQVVSIVSEKMLVAIGREANINDIGLNNTNIEIENNFIKTNNMYQTNDSHIYAVGDCIGGMQLAHVAANEGIIAVEHMAGLNPSPLNSESVPSAIYSYPEIAQIGLTEQEAKNKGYDVKIGKFPFQAIGKAHIEDDIEGFTKMVIDKDSDDILGVHIIGPNATELISEVSLAKFLDASAWELGKTIHPHPSLSEIIQETALATDDKTNP